MAATERPSTITVNTNISLAVFVLIVGGLAWNWRALSALSERLAVVETSMDQIARAFASNDLNAMRDRITRLEAQAGLPSPK